MNSLSVFSLFLLIWLNSQAETLRVGTWNIRHFAEAENAGQKTVDVAGYIASSGVQLLALQEISHDGDLESSALRALCKALSKGSASWDYRIFQNRLPKDYAQSCAVMWNRSKFRLKSKPYKLPLKKKSGEWHYWHRSPYTLKFSAGEGRSDFVLLSIHMKAFAEKKTQRLREFQLLWQGLSALEKRFQDKDILILGDSNFSRSETTYRKSLSSWQELNKKGLSTLTKSRFYESAAFDKIIVPSRQPETARAKFFVHRTLKDYLHRKLLSDHFLVYTELTILRDDD